MELGRTSYGSVKPLVSINYSSISIKIALDKDRGGPQVKVLNLGKANFDDIIF